MGAGVSSSAALEVATVIALLALAGVETDGVQIAKWAQAVENSFVGMPCGIMDQYASANGAAENAIILDCRTLTATRVPLPPEAGFLLVNSMMRHAHVDGEYRRRREECQSAARILGVRSLRDIEESELAEVLSRLPAGPAKRCRHVVGEIARVRTAERALREGDLPALGELINRSHESLRMDMEVSVDVVDRLVAIARATPGVFGARMMGGGFGGSVIALLRARDGERAMAQIQSTYGESIGQKPTAFLCRAVGAAGEVSP